MPTYTYRCPSCDSKFELFFTIREYDSSPRCLFCKSKKTDRSYADDLSSIQGSVIKSDSELKTIGDLANRNRDRMSNDQKQELYNKHNSYKEKSDKELPKGMNRIKKTQKTKWT
jgi:putative FmdB family regulatory protein